MVGISNYKLLFSQRTLAHFLQDFKIQTTCFLHRFQVSTALNLQWEPRNKKFFLIWRIWYILWLTRSSMFVITKKWPVNNFFLTLIWIFPLFCYCYCYSSSSRAVHKKREEVKSQHRNEPIGHIFTYYISVIR